MSHGVGTGGTGFDFLQQHITDTEQARLTESDRTEFSRMASGSPEWPPMRHP
eukprot:CAMPEP_0168475322 /NCGR_PEP_ID=MMETSP0228-20121227/61299_1 /TAXON_ID=133427 /ORGANISM="Protoceratium reticulatum, Strain CCCM 535 (=CCMP 1889)" /LENGTH=51 /DNA_ID=CAMNT_0008491381 /DNA_START=12 /DNA_END=163 /DNA_ORIENTATION=+